MHNNSRRLCFNLSLKEDEQRYDSYQGEEWKHFAATHYERNVRYEYVFTDRQLLTNPDTPDIEPMDAVIEDGFITDGSRPDNVPLNEGDYSILYQARSGQ